MNKKLLIVALLSIFAFSSCTQEYICQCEISYEGNQPGLPDPTIKEFFVKDTHDEATKKCEENTTEYTGEGITMTQNCRLF